VKNRFNSAFWRAVSGEKGGEGLLETAHVFGVLDAAFQHPMEVFVDQVGCKAM